MSVNCWRVVDGAKSGAVAVDDIILQAVVVDII